MPDGSGGGGEGAGGGSQGMGGGQIGANAGSPAAPAAPTFSPQEIALTRLAALVPGFGAIAGIASLGMSAINAFGSGSSSGTTGGGMGDSTSGFGGDGWGQGISSALNIAGGINALTSGGGGGSSTSGDPFGQYRAGLAAQYAGALQPGGATNIEAMPGFTQFQTGVMQPAMQASQRSAAGAGQLYSGGESAALQKIGQQGYSGFMNDYLNRLSTGSGASANPLGGADLAARLQAQQQQSVMQGIGAVGQGISGISNLFGGGSNYSNYSDSSVQAASQQMPSLIPTQQALDPLLWGEG